VRVGCDVRPQAKGNAAFSAGRFEEAVGHFSDAIKVDEGNHVLYSNRSAAHASLKHFGAALDDAKKVRE
jgi:stress-induced-phosphoprotein 1